MFICHFRVLTLAIGFDIDFSVGFMTEVLPMTLEPFLVFFVVATVVKGEAFTDLLSVLERDAFLLVVKSEVLLVVVVSVGVTCLNSDKLYGSK